MDMQKERELLKKHTYPDDDLLDRDDLSVCEKWFLMGYREAAKASAVPDGYVLVPKEPTRKIREAMYMAQHYHMSVINPDEWDAVDKSYKAMIEAAQEQNQ